MSGSWVSSRVSRIEIVVSLVLKTAQHLSMVSHVRKTIPSEAFAWSCVASDASFAVYPYLRSWLGGSEGST